jgi:hypothetical protein
MPMTGGVSTSAFSARAQIPKPHHSFLPSISSRRAWRSSPYCPGQRDKVNGSRTCPWLNFSPASECCVEFGNTKMTTLRWMAEVSAAVSLEHSFCEWLRRSTSILRQRDPQKGSNHCKVEPGSDSDVRPKVIYWSNNLH